MGKKRRVKGPDEINRDRTPKDFRIFPNGTSNDPNNPGVPMHPLGFRGQHPKDLLDKDLLRDEDGTVMVPTWLRKEPKFVIRYWLAELYYVEHDFDLLTHRCLRADQWWQLGGPTCTAAEVQKMILKMDGDIKIVEAVGECPGCGFDVQLHHPDVRRKKGDEPYLRVLCDKTRAPLVPEGNEVVYDDREGLPAGARIITR